MKKDIAKTEVSQEEQAAIAAVANATAPKTTGEKYYDRLKFATGEVFILGATAVLAYVARYGQSAYMGIPNYLKQFQDWMEHRLFGEIIPLRKVPKIGEILTVSFAGTSVTSWGGNLFSLPMKWFEDRKKKMVDSFNRGFGKPGEFEDAHERLSHEPQQSWGDVIKGRIASFSIVWISFFTAMLAAGKKEGVLRFDRFEDWGGRMLSWFTKEGEAIAKLPIAERLNNNNVTNKSYKFGRMFVLDVFATTASLIIWGAVSKHSANKRKKQALETIAALNGNELLPSSPEQESDKRDFTDSIQPREVKTELAAKAKGDDSYAAMVGKQETGKNEVVGIA